MTQPCLRSGYCCKKSPCPFGKGTPCIQLGGDEPGNYYCKIYDKIVQDTSSQVSPAFGAGCCSPLNSDRMTLASKRKTR